MRAHKIGNSNPLALYLFPEFGLGGASLKLDHVVAVAGQIRAYCPTANSANRNLSKKTGIGF
jgi:hypothetical protein